MAIPPLLHDAPSYPIPASPCGKAKKPSAIVNPIVDGSSKSSNPFFFVVDHEHPVSASKKAYAKESPPRLCPESEEPHINVPDAIPTSRMSSPRDQGREPIATLSLASDEQLMPTAPNSRTSKSVVFSREPVTARYMYNRWNGEHNSK